MQEVQQPKIGHYILGKTLGLGGFGKVKGIHEADVEAVHEFTGTKVAVKIINKKKMKNKKMSSKVKLLLGRRSARSGFCDISTTRTSSSFMRYWTTSTISSW